MKITKLSIGVIIKTVLAIVFAIGLIALLLHWF